MKDYINFNLHKIYFILLTKNNLPNYDHLVIIGNGFDLNLGYLTCYSDFLKSDEFTSLIGTNNICRLLMHSNAIKNWIDLENEIQEIQEKYRDKKTVQLKSEFIELKSSMSKYITRILDNPDFDKSSKAFSFLEGINIKETLFISFNYTDVLTKYIEKRWGRSEINRVIHIHGDYNENNLILGVEDGSDIREGHEFLLKSTNLNYLGFNLNRLMYQIAKLTIFGHSLGQTDEMYFKDFFAKHSKEYASYHLEFDLYYYDENSFDSLMSRINNLTNNNIGKFRQNLHFNPISSK